MMGSSDEFSSKRTIVTVAGDIGSGKTEVCRQVSKLTGWDVVSAGAILRKMAVEHGMTVLEFNEYAKSHPDIDREIDARIASLADSPDSVIVDSRLAWHFLPGSVKVFLVVEPAVAAARVFRATRPDEVHKSVETAGSDNAERQRIERQRFMELYSLDCDNWRNYCLVVDTTAALPEKTAEVILSKVRIPSVAEGAPDCWLDPKRLIPTRSADLSSPKISELWDRVLREGFDENTRVEIAVYRGFYLIVDGHARVSAAIRLGRPLIACTLGAFEPETAVPGADDSGSAAAACMSLQAIYDWESAHRFTYRSYPSWLRAVERV